MASNAGIFFAGVGTTFIILGAGFGAGIMMATSALKDPVGYQKHTSDEPPPQRESSCPPPQRRRNRGSHRNRPRLRRSHHPLPRCNQRRRWNRKSKGRWKRSTPRRPNRNNASVASGTQNAKQGGRRNELNASSRSSAVNLRKRPSWH
jgi:hypothetical protein